MNAFTIVFLLISAYTASVPTLVDYKTLLKQMKHQSNQNLTISNNPPLCGTYEFGCGQSDLVDINTKLRLYGQKSKVPKKASMIISTYHPHYSCSSHLMTSLRIESNIISCENNNYNYTVTNVFLTFDYNYISYYGCSGVHAGKEFSVKKAKCIVDGEDQLTSYKELIGSYSVMNLLFDNTSVNLDDNIYLRVSNASCQLSTFTVSIIVFVVVALILSIVIFIIIHSKHRLMRKS